MILMDALLLLTVPSEPRPKNTARRTSSGSVSNVVVQRQRQVGDVVGDADREPRPGRLGGQLVEDGLRHRRVELLRRQAVAAPDDPRQGWDRRSIDRVDERRGHVQQQRLSGRARFLGAVEHRDRPHGRREGLGEPVHRERPVEPHLDQADLLAAGDEVVDDLVRALGARAHHHHDPFGFGVPDVVEQPVAAPGQLGEPVHGVGDDRGAGVVEGVRGFAGLEERVGVLRRPADHRAVRRQRPGPVRGDGVVVDEGIEDGVVDRLDLLDLVRGAEPVEEVQERHPRPQRRGVADGGQVDRFLR